MSSSMFAFATALITSVGLTPVARRIAFRLDIVDRPNARKIHHVPMPLLGGLAMYIAAVLAIALVVDPTDLVQLVGVLGGATGLLAIGILDDRGLLHHQIKLMIAMPLAAILLIVSGVRTTVFEAIFVSSSTSAEIGMLLLGLDYVLTFFWIVGITAAFSIFDHMDGLCAGVVMVASSFFLIFALLNGQILVSVLAAAVLGAALGFLRWNFNPARIFMGDGGAMFLGFMMAALGLSLRPANLLPEISWMIPVLILGVTIFDTTLITISRTRRGLMPFAAPGKDHVAHRLVSLGLNQRRAVLTLYGLSGLLGLLALLVPRLTTWQSYALLGLFALAAGAAIVALERAPYERQRKAAPGEQTSAGHLKYSDAQ